MSTQNLSDDALVRHCEDATLKEEQTTEKCSGKRATASVIGEPWHLWAMRFLIDLIALMEEVQKHPHLQAKADKEGN